MGHTRPGIESVVFRAGRRSTGAFTLVELTISLAIVGIILLGVASALGLATSALPDERSRSADSLRQTLRVMSQDLSDAVLLREIGAAAIECTVPDRDGDGLPEVLRYERGTNPGDPLVRTSDGVSTNLSGSLSGFTIAPNTQQVSEPIATTSGASAESTLASVPADTGASSTWATFDKRSGYAQLVDPKLPAGAGVWTMTQLRYICNVWDNNNDHQKRLVQIRLADANGLPTQTVLFEATFDATQFALRPWEYSTLTVQGMPDLHPDQRVCVCFVNPEDKVRTGYAMKKTMSSGSGLATTADQGKTWSAQASTSLFVQVVGTYVEAKTSASLVRTFATGLNIAVADEFAQTVTMPTGFSSPCELLTDWWRTDFESDPRYDDFNGDGSGDWTSTKSGYPSSDLIAGWLRADATLGIPSRRSFGEPTDMRVRLRIDTNNHIWYTTISVDRSLVLATNLTLEVTRSSDTLSRLRVMKEWPVPGTVLLDRTITTGTMELRLVALPSQSTLTLYLGDALVGAVTYTRSVFVDTNTTPILTFGTDPKVMVDWLEVRLGGTVK